MVQKADQLKGEQLFNEILAPNTSWHIGGPADRYYSPYDLEDLQAFLKQLPPEEPITWLGLGSNVLIADEGIRGTVIHTLGMKSQVQQISENIIRAEAGIPCAKVSKFCAKHNLKGGEFFSGIPGTIGGALAMNAGAFGGETWPCVSKVEVINRFGEIITRSKDEYEIAYRSVRRKTTLGHPENILETHTEASEEWFVAGHFQFEAGDAEESTAAIKALLKKRNNTQPIGVFSCGSVFKNPQGAYVGQLIEKSGLKRYKIGGAEISTKHGNFIINTGNATAKDVLALMRYIVEKIYADHNILLESEVRVLGYPDPKFWYPSNLCGSLEGTENHAIAAMK